MSELLSAGLPWWIWTVIILGVLALAGVVGALFLPDWSQPDYQLGTDAEVTLRVRHQRAVEPSLVFGDGVACGFAVVEYRVHLVSDGHFETGAVGEFLNGAGGVDAFRDFVQGGCDFS